MRSQAKIEPVCEWRLLDVFSTVPRYLQYRLLYGNSGYVPCLARDLRHPVRPIASMVVGGVSDDALEVDGTVRANEVSTYRLEKEA